MYSHIQIGARDVPALAVFYDGVLATLGLVRIVHDEDRGPAGAGWQRPGLYWPQFYIQSPINGLPATWGNGVQVSFAAHSIEQVQAAWDTALRLGGTDEGAPGNRPQYGDDYYGAYCRDPEGNKLCFVFARSMAIAQERACSRSFSQWKRSRASLLLQISGVYRWSGPLPKRVIITLMKSSRLIF